MSTPIPIDQITLYTASANAFNNSPSFLSQFQQGWQNLSANLSFDDGIPSVDLGSGLTADQMGPIVDATITSVIKEFPTAAESLTGSMKVVGNAAEIGAFGFAVDFATKVSNAQNGQQVLQAVVSSGIDFGVNYAVGLGVTFAVDALFTLTAAEAAIPVLLALILTTAIDQFVKEATHDDHKTIGDVFLDAAAQLSNTNLAIAKFSTAILETAGVAFMADFNNLVKQAEGSLFQYDPLLIDLNGDGIKTTTTDNGTFFNLTQNGFAFRTAWVNGNDGILVRDLNNNGQIDDSSELFGNQTVLANGSKSANGFQALADLDSNHDGVINASDAAFSQLKVLKGDGTLLTLAQAGIQSFNLTSTPTNTVDTSGNTQLSVGSFTKTDNSTGQYGDYNLQSDTSNSIALQNVSVPPDIAALPNIKGFGTVYDLQQAMAMDTTGTLKGLVQSFINTTDPAQQNTLLDQILAQWTGTVDVGQYNSFITYMSPVHAAVVSQSAGHPYLNSLGYNDVHFVPAAFMSQAYYQLTEYVYGQLMAQTQLSTYFNEIQASQDATTGQTSLDLTQVTQSLQQLNTTDHQSAVNTAAAFSRAFKGLNLQADETNYAAFYSSMTALGSDFKTAMDDADKIVVNGTSLNDTIGSTPAFASRDSRAMVLYGQAGDDILRGTYGNDSLIGGTGSDLLYGMAGDDTYIFNSGDGRDTIVEGNPYLPTADGGNDTLQFGTGINQNNVTFTQTGNNLVIAVNGTTDQVTVQNGLDPNKIGYRVENFVFGDGSSLTLDQVKNILQVVNPPSGNLNITGDPYANNALSGYDGNDTLSGGSGNDTLYGGGGNDALYAWGGNNYVQGDDGNDSINASDGNDTLIGGDGNDTIASSDGNDYMQGDAGNDSLSVGPLGTGNDTLVGGLDNDTLLSGAGNDYLEGDEGNDSITAGAGNDTLIGGPGFDAMYGDAGNDLYVINLGDGQDFIQDSGGNDTIQFGPGISANNLYFSPDASGDILTIHFTNSSDSITVQNQFSTGQPGYQIEQFKFNDGTILSSSDVLSQLEIHGTGNADILNGSPLSEKLYGYEGNDALYGGGGNDTFIGGAGNDSLNGGSGNDIYQFSDAWGNDFILSDGGGTDSVDFSATTANLTINLNAGASAEATDGLNTVNWNTNIIENAFGGSGNDSLLGNSANNLLSGGSGNDTLNGSSGNDTLNGGDGNDTYIFTANWGQDSLIDSGGSLNVIDLTAINTNLTVNLNSGSITDTGADSVSWSSPTLIEQLLSGAGNDVITGNGSVASNLWGKAGNDTITGGSGNDTIAGGAGNDSLIGGSGDDVYIFFNSSGVDTISDTAGTDTIDLSNTTVAFTVNLDSTLTPEITDGLGDTVTWTGDVIENAVAGSANDTLNGNSGNNLLTGNAGNDTINGGNGNDTLTGGTGNDSLAGGAGDDVYKFVSGFGTDTINDSSGSNTLDLGGYTSNLATVSLAGTSFVDGVNTVSWAANTLQNLVTGSGNDSLSGNALDNLLTAGAGNDSLNGGSGNDTLNGGDGNDVYTFASGFGNDSIIDGSGIDTLDLSQLSGDLTVNLASGTYSSINWVGSALENLSTGSGNDNLIGTAANNLLSGGAGNDTLDGSGGSDTLNGGDGNDTYIFTANWGKDSVIDSGGSLDTLDLTAVDSNLTVNLNAGSVSDNLSNAISWSSTIEQVFSGSGNDVMTGNSTLASNLYGGAGNDTITGGAGNDTLIGGFGNDSLLGGAGDDFYSFSPLFGSDTLVDVSGSDTLDLRAYTNNLSVSLSGTTFNDGLGSTVNWSGSTLENLNTGSGNDTLTGNSANNILNGGGGNDQYIFSAGWGQDTIIDSSGNDLVDLSAVTANLTVDLSGASSPAVSDGTDTIVWSGGVIEQALAGSGNDLLTASGSSSLSGGAGNDTLVGSVAGNDTLTGGTGNDIYIVNNANTIINEAGGAGTDSVQSGVSFSIGGNLGNVENLTLTGTANINATGNWQHNLITGNSGNNVLDDGDTGSPYKASGADTLSGGAGNDTYLVNNTGDVINEAAGAGVDAVQSSVSYSIGGNMGNVENLTLTGTANINAAGNWQANVLTGNSGNNVLDDGNENSPYTVSDTLIGGLGNDSLIGGKGNDVYIFNLGDGVDTITENDSTAGNMDTVQFNSSVIQSHVAFFMSGNNLQIGYTDNSTDQITINNQSLSSGTVEKFLLSNGKFLTSSDVNSIIQSMSSYAGSHGESFSSLSDVRNNADLMNIIAAGWHS